jgi:hypothetical protein
MLKKLAQHDDSRGMSICARRLVSLAALAVAFGVALSLAVVLL